jgi:hypothetical protein
MTLRRVLEVMLVGNLIWFLATLALIELVEIW